MKIKRGYPESKLRRVRAKNRRGESPGFPRVKVAESRLDYDAWKAAVISGTQTVYLN